MDIRIKREPIAKKILSVYGKISPLPINPPNIPTKIISGFGERGYIPREHYQQQSMERNQTHW
jgi:hypothetical protein